jgi:hypothetical protein
MNVIDKPALLSVSHFSNNLRRVARPGAVHVNTQLTEPVSAPPQPEAARNCNRKAQNRAAFRSQPKHLFCEESVPVDFDLQAGSFLVIPGLQPDSAGLGKPTALNGCFPEFPPNLGGYSQELAILGPVVRNGG